MYGKACSVFLDVEPMFVGTYENQVQIDEFLISGRLKRNWDCNRVLWSDWNKTSPVLKTLDSDLLVNSMFHAIRTACRENSISAPDASNRRAVGFICRARKLTHDSPFFARNWIARCIDRWREWQTWTFTFPFYNIYFEMNQRFRSTSLSSL